MTKRLEELLNLPPVEPQFSTEATIVPEVMNLQGKLDEFDKISAALPMVDGLGNLSDTEYDTLANKAQQAFDDLMDLGMNVEARYSTRMFEVAGTMLNAAIAAKTAKIDKKLKMVDLQLKKLAIDNKSKPTEQDAIEGEGYIITDRNSILEKIKNMKN